MMDDYKHPFIVNRKSWHYILNMSMKDSFMCSDNWEQNHRDFCSYWRKTVFNIIVATMITVAAFAFLGAIAYLAFLAPSVIMTAFFTTVFLFVVVLCLAWSIVKARSFYKNKLTERRTCVSLLMQKYRTRKDKICPMVDYD
jgi:small-conductance mechanosensitive channel